MIFIILSIVFAIFLYNKFDKGVYKCSNVTHLFGMIFPLLVIMKVPNKYVLPSAYAMLTFHLIHDYNVNKNTQ